MTLFPNATNAVNPVIYTSTAPTRRVTCCLFSVKAVKKKDKIVALTPVKKSFNYRLNNTRNCEKARTRATSSSRKVVQPLYHIAVEVFGYSTFLPRVQKLLYWFAVESYTAKRLAPAPSPLTHTHPRLVVVPRVELLREKLGIFCPREAVRVRTDLPVIVHTIRSGVFSAGLLNCRKSTAQTCVWEGTCERGHARVGRRSAKA